MTRVSPEDLDAFVRVFEASDWDRALLRVDGIEVQLSKKNGTGVVRSQRPLAEDSPDRPFRPEPARQVTAVNLASPHIATFHRGAMPGGLPCVEVGTAIGIGTQIGCLVVLRDVTPLRAQVSGTVEEILVEDAALVEFGEVIMRIRPSV